jgi:stress-induced morphogen
MSPPPPDRLDTENGEFHDINVGQYRNSIVSPMMRGSSLLDEHILVRQDLNRAMNVVLESPSNGDSSGDS